MNELEKQPKDNEGKGKNNNYNSVLLRRSQNSKEIKVSILSNNRSRDEEYLRGKDKESKAVGEDPYTGTQSATTPDEQENSSINDKEQ